MFVKPRSDIIKLTVRAKFMNRTQTQKGFLRPKVLIPVILLILAGLATGVILNNYTNLFHKSTPATKIVKKVGLPNGPTSNVPSSSAAKTPTNNNSSPTGGSQDTNGTAPTTTSQNQWIVSQSGNITLKQPVVNSTLQNGAVISGSAKVSQVDFRLIDNQIGVIAQGVLNVVNGNFSGIMHFQNKASTGQLDVFSTQPNGAEINEIQLSVNF